ncbi:MAG: alkaline phosphatase family protein, partial [Anaerolineae bacterium]|nr:alkaline phosphatase family protein [Anaerolineae bacterium]
WDGADWRILRPLMRAGYMPNLTALVECSAVGDLLSTQPAVTGPAWSSFMTGKSPARHGLLSWQRPLNASLERPWVNASELQGPTIWDLLSRAGLRLGVLNVPLTFPPPRIHGELISGLLTPSTASQFTHPAGLREALLAKRPSYRIDVDLQHTEWDTRSPEGIEQFLAEVNLALSDRQAALDFLWSHGPFDVFMVVYETPDRLQHPLYQFVASQPTEVRPDWDDIRYAVYQIFKRLDAALGDLLSRVDEDTLVILLSDHGFGPLRAVVHLNDWLAQAGYLRWEARANTARSVLRRALAPVRRRLPQRWVRRGRAVFSPLRLTDWGRTVAYSGLPTEEGIWINVRGREPFGQVEPGATYERLRDEIIEAALALRDPLTGQPIVRTAQRREEVHDGPFVERAPDIVLTLHEGYKVTPGRATRGLVDDVEKMGRGIHRREGILAITGPDISTGEITGAALPDMLPTILAHLGLPLTEEMDGRPLFGAEDVSIRSSEPSGQESAYDYTDEEAALIEKRLADLGYLE